MSDVLYLDRFRKSAAPRKRIKIEEQSTIEMADLHDLLDGAHHHEHMRPCVIHGIPMYLSARAIADMSPHDRAEIILLARPG
jgi:hypothetical protein